MKNINIFIEIEKLLNFGIEKKFIQEVDKVYFRNKLLNILNINSYENIEETEKLVKDMPLEESYKILEQICEWGAKSGLIEDTFNEKDLLDAKVIGEIVPRPSEVIKKFFEDYKISPKIALENYYKFSQETNYIRMDRIAKNHHWYADTEYGDLEITINLSKPEKDPRDIAKAKLLPASSYPKCLLCKENEGYAGNANHPARQNHRIIPINLTKEEWFLQYSPYVYYNEHCIIFSGEHRPMGINRGSFERILEFVDMFPNYFVGSNADLPIVGGSILSHDHFQGGYHDFPMAIAKKEKDYVINGYEDIAVEKVFWPMSVIRLRGESFEKIVELSDKILTKWRGYSDEKVGILSYTEDVPHNTITPIGRKIGNLYEIDLVLRNNRTTEEYPLGIFHPHEELHHIKKENIGLIEVMGLAVLPGRLKEEMEILGKYLLEGNSLELIERDEKVNKHFDWAKKIHEKYSELSKENIDEILKVEIGLVFSKVLEDAGVFKKDQLGKEGYDRFIESLNS